MNGPWTREASPKVRAVGAALAGLVFLLLVGATLRLSLLSDVDELTHAIVAQEAARDGHWMPLTKLGQPWWEKPPVMIWLAAATYKVTGQAEFSMRLWTALAGSAMVALAFWAASGLRRRLHDGLLAAGLLACTPDLIFHSRYLTMDTALFACFLGALAFLARAWDHEPGSEGARRAAQAAGLCLGAAAALKSWFVFTFAPALVLAAWAARPAPLPPARLAWRLAWPALAALAAWLGLYTWAYGPAFLLQEWQVNTFGRAVHGNPIFAGVSNWQFYGVWAQNMAPAVLGLAPVAVALALQAALRGDASRGARFTAAFAAFLALTWGCGALVVRHQVINYLLGFELGVCLAWAAAWALRPGPVAAFALLASAVLAVQGLWRPVPPALSLGLGALLCLPVLAARGRALAGRWAAAGRAARVVAAALVLALLAHRAWHFLWRPPDLNRGVVTAMAMHPARTPGEPLLYVGHPTQSLDFYTRYRVSSLQALPQREPREALLLETAEGCRFKPAAGGRP